jgi:PH (Pleckstrin Homology) domain-containing protein
MIGLGFFKALTLSLMRVPAEPHLPAGDPGSARVFRAGLNYWRLRWLWWIVHQAFTLAVFILMLVLLHNVPDTLHVKQGKGESGRTVAVPIAGAVVAARVVEAVSWVLWLVQMPLTFALARLDYEMRWYIVTDRAARLRDGILKVNEMTLTLANVQDIRINQGPLQRLLGLADVELRTAGGSETSPNPHTGQGMGANLHLARFRGVDNAPEIRDLVRERMKHARGAGLGDPDDSVHEETAPGSAEALTLAIHAITREAAALRQAVGTPPSRSGEPEEAAE